MDITLPSGKVINAHAGIIGIDKNGAIYDGYDGRIFDPDHGDGFDSEQELTPVEQAELADVMMERWSAFKHRAILDHESRHD